MSLFNFVKSNLQILDVIQEYVNVRRMGNYYKGSCPFHHETDASFTVSPDKHIFYCFGCHTGGDVIAFVAKAENITQMEAVKHIIDRYKIVVPPEILASSKQELELSPDEKNRYFYLCEQVARYAHQELKESNIATQYITERAITPQMVTQFLLGYLPGSVRGIQKLTHAMTRVGVLIKDLVEYGILIENKNGYYSPFEERILFPITDTLGRYCGFGGRIFRPGDERAKYYNSKDAPCFSKGKLLFGLNNAKDAMHKANAAFMVEGYTDCIGMTQHGFANTVATLGTACTSDHLKLIARHVRTLFILYDGDNAGQKAVLRLAELCWDINLELRVVTLPYKEDPASFLGKGGNLTQAIDQARDLFSFFVDALGTSFAQKSVSEKYELCNQMIEVVAKVPDQFKRDLLIQRAAGVMQVPFDSLKNLLEQQIRKAPFTSPGSLLPEQINIPSGGDVAAELLAISPLEKQILFAMINNVRTTSWYQIPEDVLPYFSARGSQLLTRLYALEHHHNASERFNTFFASLDEHEKQWITRHLVAYQEEVSEQLFNQYIAQFRRQHWKAAVQHIKQCLHKAQQDQDQETYQELMKKFVSLQQQMKNKGLL